MGGAGARDAAAAEILAVIEGSHRAFWMRDLPAYLSFQAPGPATQRWGYWHHGGIMVRKGADDLARRVADYMAATPDPRPRLAYEAPISDVSIRVGGDMAWATLMRHYPRTPGMPPGQLPNGPIHELFILERGGDGWKIAVTGLLDPYVGDDLAVRVDADGTILWRSEVAADALPDDDEFKVQGGRLRLRNRTLDIQLQTLIRRAAAVDAGFMSARGATPLVLSEGDDRPRVCWVVADAGMVLVILDDRRPARDRAAYAAGVFSLSAAQTRLAEAVVDGMALTDFARRERISPNTARTHLQRVFDKVGVRSQPALVRVLLSLTAPR